MKKHLLTAAAAMTAILGSYAADADPILMTVDGHPIRVSEFEYLYNKNNSQQVQPQTLDSYLDMFVDYKLKVADAEHAGLHTTENFRNEYNTYRNELSAPFMRDTTVYERLVAEAYERFKLNVSVSHIMLPPTDEGKHQADSLYSEITAGNITFEEAASKFSMDRVSKRRGGDMGIVYASRYPYAFEMASYNTEVGEITKPVNSGLGWHLIKVNEKAPARGEVNVQHILLFTNNRTYEEIEVVRQRIDSLYQKAVAGEDFSQLARKYSQDTGSARDGGNLGWFGPGAMVQEFDSVSFALPDGAISQPFTTQFGYHIIHKIGSRFAAPIEELRPKILKAIEKDERGSMAEDAVIDRVMLEYNAKVEKGAIKKISKLISKNATGCDEAMIECLSSMDMTVAKYKGHKLALADVMPAIEIPVGTDAEQATEIISAGVLAELRNAVKETYRDHLEETNTDYRNLLNEYRDGILLYSISNSTVWDRAVKDTEGLEQYFNENRDRYAWDKPKFKSFIIFANNDSILNEAVTYANSLEIGDATTLSAKMSERFNKDVRVERVIAAKGENAITDYLGFGGKKPAADGRSRWTSYAAFQGRVVVGPENAADVRGAVVADYQNELDRRWREELHAKYKVNINKDVFESLKAAQ